MQSEQGGRTDRIKTPIVGAAVTANGASGGGSILKGSVKDIVAPALAVALIHTAIGLEGMVETDPVSDFVSQGLERNNS